MTDGNRRRRLAGRLALLLGGAIALVGALVAGSVATARFGGPAVLTFAGTGDAVTLPQFGERGAHVLRYAHGEPVTFSFPLHNRSRLPVRVESVHLSERELSMLTIDDVTIGSDPLPATVGGGDTATVTVTATYANCRYYHEREIELIEDVTIDGSALGVGVTRHVPLDHDLVLRSPMIVGCPDRTLVRDDDPHD